MPLVALRRVGRAVFAHPTAVAFLTGAVCGTAGDLGAQMVEHRQHTKGAHTAARPAFRPDMTRMVGVGFFQACMGAFCYLPVYGALDAKFGAAPTVKGVAIKILVDTGLMLPLFETPLFLAYTALLEGHSPRHRLETNYRETSEAGMVFKAPVSFVNFVFVPPALRIPVLDAADLVWTAIASFLGHREDPVESMDSHTEQK